MRVDHIPQQRALCLGIAVLCLTAANLFAGNTFLDVQLFLPRDDDAVPASTTKELLPTPNLTVPTTTLDTSLLEPSNTFPFLRDWPAKAATTTTNTTNSDAFDFSQLGCGTSECGWYKCYYPSKTQHMGYLLATNDNLHVRGSIGTLQSGWRVAEFLTQWKPNDNYQFRHLLAGPSLHIHPSESEVAFLNKGCATEVRKFEKKTLADRYSTNHSIVIQPTIPIQRPYFMLSCSLQSGTFHRWKGFVRDTRKHTNITASQFAAQFAADLRVIRHITSIFPLFWYDFQMVVLPSGEVWHLDLDRFFVPIYVNETATPPVSDHNTTFHREPPSAFWQGECSGMLSALERWARKVARTEKQESTKIR